MVTYTSQDLWPFSDKYTPQHFDTSSSIGWFFPHKLPLSSEVHLNFHQKKNGSYIFSHSFYAPDCILFRIDNFYMVKFHKFSLSNFFCLWFADIILSFGESALFWLHQFSIFHFLTWNILDSVAYKYSVTFSSRSKHSLHNERTVPYSQQKS